MRVRRVALALIVAIASGSCTGGTTEAASFDLVEYDIAGPSVVDANDSISLTNSGEYPHTLVVTDQSGRVAASTALISPGAATEIQLQLDPGRYQFTCRIVAQDGEGNIVDHFERGMTLSVDVSSP
jgi:plastocyanin